MAQFRIPHSVSRRAFMSGAAGAAAAFALSACSTKPGGDSTSSGGGPTTITLWYWDDLIKATVDAFHKSQSRIKVKFQKLSYDDVNLKLLTSIAAGGGGPDVSVVDFNYIGGFSAVGGLVDLSKEPYNANQFKDDFVPYKWAQSTSKDGRLFAFPWDIGPGGLWYRTDIFEAAGLETDPAKVQAIVKTWDDWIQLGVDLRKKLPNMALIANAYYDTFWPLVLQQPHGQGWFVDGKVDVLQRTTPALELARKARDAKIDAQIQWWTTDWDVGVTKKAFAGMGVASWEQSLLLGSNPKTSGSWRIIRAPGQDWNWGGGFYVIPETSEKKEAAWEFIKFAAATAEGQNVTMKKSGIFPGYKPAWKDPFYDEPVDFFGGQKAYRLWSDIGTDAPGSRVAPGFLQADNIVNAAVDKIDQHGADPTKTMNDAVSQILKQVPPNKR